jgi:putative ABC transport system permease protein
VWLYRQLLVAYPAPFRHEFAGEMIAAFRARCVEETSRAGWLGLAQIWIETIPDTAVSAAKEHYFMLAQEIRFAARVLAKSPGFAAAAVACLALGIGASTAIFSIVNAVLLKPLPYRDSRNFIRVYTEFRSPTGEVRFPSFAASPPEFRNLQAQNSVWNQLEAWSTGTATLSTGSQPTRIAAAFISGGMMSMLGAQPRLGRAITPADDQPGKLVTVLISDGLWKRAFGRDQTIVNKQIVLNGAKAVVAGVMPPGFEFPPGAREPMDAWVPLQLTPQNMQQRASHFLALVAHLNPGMTLARAREGVKLIVRDLGVEASARVHAINPKGHPLVISDYQEDTIGRVRKPVSMLLGAVGFFLLIACVNVANLLLARSDSRRREVAVRKALGAGAWQLARQFAVEGLILAFVGAVVGLAVAAVGLRLIIALDGGSIPRIREAGIDPRVLLFAGAVTLATGAAFCLAPLMQSFGQPVNDALKSAGTRLAGSVGAGRLRAFLVISEIALALILLVGSGLMIRAFWNLRTVNTGIRTDHLLTARVALSGAAYQDQNRVRDFWIRLNEGLRTAPGITAVTLASGLPPERQAGDNDTDIENFVPRPGGPVQNVAYYQVVGDNFFRALGAKIVEGRPFDERDGFGANPVAIVNQAMAKTFWPGESAIGKRVRPSGTNREWMTIVGVVGDILNDGLAKPPRTEIFLAARQLSNASTGITVLARTNGEPVSAAAAVRKAVRDLDPTVPVSRILSMDDVVDASAAQTRFLAAMLTLFSGFAVVLAGFGIYGVISYSVAQRTPEFGIRMAFGAARSDVIRQVLGEGLTLGIYGAVLGAGGALVLTRILEGLLFRVSRFDPAIFIATSVLLIAVAVVACGMPARRATGVDPMKALRYE